MMGPGEVIIALIVIGLPMMAIFDWLFNRWFKLKEKRLEVEANLAAEKAAQYAALERRA